MGWPCRWRSRTRLCVALRDGRLSSIESPNRLAQGWQASLSRLHGPARLVWRWPSGGCCCRWPYHDLLPWLLALSLRLWVDSNVAALPLPVAPCLASIYPTTCHEDICHTLSSLRTGVQRDEHPGPFPFPVRPTRSRPSICEMRECIPSSPCRWETKMPPLQHAVCQGG